MLHAPTFAIAKLLMLIIENNCAKIRTIARRENRDRAKIELIIPAVRPRFNIALQLFFVSRERGGTGTGGEIPWEKEEIGSTWAAG